jgi:hypothetical protein
VGLFIDNVLNFEKSNKVDLNNTKISESGNIQMDREIGVVENVICDNCGMTATCYEFMDDYLCKNCATNSEKSDLDKVTESEEQENSSDKKLIAFFYILMRDYLPCGNVEKIVIDIVDHIDIGSIYFTNKYLAKYSKEIVNRLKEE